MSPHEHNRRAWDARARQQARFAVPARRDELIDPLARVDAPGWLADGIAGKRVLCLAAGGGRHGPLYAAAGAIVTVVDLSDAMLALDRQYAAEQQIDLRTVQASMDDLGSLPAAGFDVVIQPVSTCYVPDVAAVYREVARVLVSGGSYISQHKQPASLQADVVPSPRGYELIEPWDRTGPLPPVAGSLHREEGTLEYLHTLEQLLGGMCRAGFVIEDVIEPLHARADAAPGDWGHRSRYVAPYLRVKARRVGSSAGGGATLWVPDSSRNVS